MSSLLPSSRLQAMKREANLHELKALDEARKRYLQHQHAVKELELKKMDREIQKKVRNKPFFYIYAISFSYG